jgi:hypothetical protein
LLRSLFYLFFSSQRPPGAGRQVAPAAQAGEVIASQLHKLAPLKVAELSDVTE